jgi:hypothetical protein
MAAFPWGLVESWANNVSEGGAYKIWKWFFPNPKDEDESEYEDPADVNEFSKGLMGKS